MCDSGNPYSKLRERNKREANTDWRTSITRAPYVVSGDTGSGEINQPQPANRKWRDRDGQNRRNKANRQTNHNINPQKVSSTI